MIIRKTEISKIASQYLREIFDKPLTTSNSPSVEREMIDLGGPFGYGDYSDFEVDGQKFRILARPFGPKHLKMIDLGFIKDTGRKGQKWEWDITGKSKKEIFKILSTVVDWFMNWINRNDKWKSFIVAGSSEDERSGMYRKIIEKKIKGTKWEKLEGKIYDPITRNNKAVYIIWNPDDKADNPEWFEDFSRMVSDYFEIEIL